MFDFEIHFIFIENYVEGMMISEKPSALYFLMSVYDVKKDYLSSPRKRIYTWDRNRFSWYIKDISGARYQLNEKGMKYCYIAF